MSFYVILHEGDLEIAPTNVITHNLVLQLMVALVIGVLGANVRSLVARILSEQDSDSVTILLLLMAVRLVVVIACRCQSVRQNLVPVG